MMYYKSLREDMCSWYDNKFKWNKKSTEVMTPDTSTAPCSIGLHLAKTIPDAVGYGKFPCVLWEVEPLSEILGEDNTKIRVAKARLIRKMRTQPIWVVAANRFIKSIPRVKFFAEHKKRLPTNCKIFPNGHAAKDAARNAAGDAAWDAAWHAAWDAARNAAGDAAWDAARAAAGDAAGDAAWDAARAAAWDAAKDAAWHAAWDAAKDAAWDAATYAKMLICIDLNLKKKHWDYIKTVWQIWKAGYGCLGKYGNTLYCYEKP